MMTSLRLTFIFWGLFLIGFLSCFGSGKFREHRYYVISYFQKDLKTGGPYPYTLRIHEMGIAKAYDEDRIIYRYSPYQLQYYNYEKWITKPQKIITEAVKKHILKTNLFTTITDVYSVQIPDYELTGEVQGIEEYDSDNKWYAHLAMEFRLIRFKDQKTVISYIFDVRKEVFYHKPLYIVKTISQIFEEQMYELQQRIDRYFSTLKTPATKK